mgnify:FL=1
MLGTPDVFDMLSGVGLFWDSQLSTDISEAQLAYYLRQMRQMRQMPLVDMGCIWKKFEIL